MSVQLISSAALERALNLRDLSDPLQGPHAMQQLVQMAHESLAKYWNCRRIVYRGCPLVSVKDNYDRLGYPPEGVVRDARYRRYVTLHMMLRAHTSAMIPGLLRSISHELIEDLLLVCPGMVYRRDTIDRIHSAEPHHLDLWRISAGDQSLESLERMIAIVVETLLPGYEYRTLSSRHHKRITNRRSGWRSMGRNW